MKFEIKNQQRKINKTKSWVFEKISNIDKSLAKMTEKEKVRKLVVSEIYER